MRNKNDLAKRLRKLVEKLDGDGSARLSELEDIEEAAAYLENPPADASIQKATR